MITANGAIRVMGASEVPAGLRLSQQAHWNQTSEDWRRLLAWEPAGCFVLVDAAYRQRGFGRRLLLHALAHLAERGISAVMLDATPLGQPLYQSHGFHELFFLDRWQGIAEMAAVPSRKARLRQRSDLSQALLDLDRRAFGVDRRRLLGEILTAPDSRCYWAGTDDLPAGYVLLRPGAQRWHLGPLVATNAADAAILLQTALAEVAGQPVEIDVPRRPATQEIIGRAGLAPVRPFIRMARGEPLPSDEPPLLYATAGPEVG